MEEAEEKVIIHGVLYQRCMQKVSDLNGGKSTNLQMIFHPQPRMVCHRNQLFLPYYSLCSEWTTHGAMWRKQKLMVSIGITIHQETVETNQEINYHSLHFHQYCNQFLEIM